LSPATDGHVFREVTRHGRVGDSALSGWSVARVVQRVAAAVGLDASSYAGHSLRAGLATSAAREGTCERSIMNQTGHRSTAMVRRYIRAAELFRENAAAGLL
jgi:integrase